MKPPVERSRRYLSLDVWRGVACLMVLLHHASVALSWEEVGGDGLEAWLRRGILSLLKAGVGPPLFFVMSGYCVAASIDSFRRKGTSPLGFLAKRLWRTFPPYWVALLGFVAVVTGLDALGLGRLHGGLVSLELTSPATLTRAQWLGNLTLTESWRPLVGGGEGNEFTRIAWSLCYQEQFYLVCFLVMVVAPRRFHAVLAAATVAIVGFRVFAWDSGGLSRIDGTFPVLWHEFAVGLAVYWRFNRAPSRGARWGIDLCLAGLLVVACWTQFESTAEAAALGLALIALRRWDERIAGLSWLDPLRACGRRCYSIYLVHLPICAVGNHCLYELGMTGFWARALVMVPLVSLASVGAGWLFYRGVESRFVQLPDLHRALSGLSSLLSLPFELDRLLVARRPGLRLLALGAVVSVVVVLPSAAAGRAEGPSGGMVVVTAPPAGAGMGRAKGWPGHQRPSRGRARPRLDTALAWADETIPCRDGSHEPASTPSARSGRGPSAPRPPGWPAMPRRGPSSGRI
jgi:peptidoglycan/LPS O-acetylase OafA/YrhL